MNRLLADAADQNRSPTLTEIKEAQARLAEDGTIEPAPLRRSEALESFLGRRRGDGSTPIGTPPFQVWVKYENLQYTGAYKEKGALNRLIRLREMINKLPPEQARQLDTVYTASAGNHAQALGFHGTRYGFNVEIYMPTKTPAIKVTRSESHQSGDGKFKTDVKVYKELGGGRQTEIESYEDAVALAVAAAKSKRMQASTDDHGAPPREDLEPMYVPAFDARDIIAGQGVVGLEILEEMKRRRRLSPPKPGEMPAGDAGEYCIDTILVPIGGGGLISGIALALKESQAGEHIKLIGVQAVAYPAAYMKYKAYAQSSAYAGPEVVGADVVPDEGSDLWTLAEGIQVKNPGSITTSIIQEYVDDILLVEEDFMEDAVGRLVELCKTVVEGAGSVGLAALIKYCEKDQRAGTRHEGSLFCRTNDEVYQKYLKGKKICIILSGGNIDTRLMSGILIRDMLRWAIMFRIRIEAPDTRGQLLLMTQILSEHNINIIDMKRIDSYTDIPAKKVKVEIVCESSSQDRVDQAIAQLRKVKGFEADRIDTEEEAKGQEASSSLG
jgi:threonine dehydratase